MSLKWSQKVLYAMPTVGITFLMGPVMILQGIYAKYFGLALSTIAIVLLISKLFDALTDPLIGYLCDRFYLRHGSRKPFVFFGGILFVVSSYFLYVPFGSNTSTIFEIGNLSFDTDVSSLYFLLWFLAFYLGFTLFEIPHLAWARDLSASAEDKTQIYGWRAGASFFGSMLFFATPLLPIFDTNSFTPQSLQWSVIAAGVLLFPAIFVCITNLPNSSRVYFNGDTRPSNFKKLKSIRLLIFGNPSLVWFLAALFCAGAGAGMWFGLVFLYVDIFLQLGEYFALIYVISLGLSILTVGGWARLITVLGRKPVWGVAMATMMFGFLGSSQISPSGQAQAELLFFTVLIYCGFVGWTILAPSLLTEVIDYGSWKFGSDQAGIYFSLYTLMTKINVGLGGALSLGIAGSYGFEATAATQSAEAIFGLRFSMSWLPVPFMLASICFMSLIPLDTRRNEIIQNRLCSKGKRMDI